MRLLVPVTLDNVDADVPHVMISYQWGAQTTMLAVKERLKAEGYKVWMDVDNMSKLMPITTIFHSSDFCYLF